MAIDQIISVESGGNPYAKNPRSSATGSGQFIDSTWLNMMNKYRPDLIAGMSRDQILAMRSDPSLSKEMVGNYAKENQGLLGAAGVPVNDGTTYLAHFAGPQGAIKILQADPSAPVGGILGDKVVAANPFLANMTAGDLVGWAGKKMGAAPAALPQQPFPQAAPQQNAQPASPQAVPASLQPSAMSAPPTQRGGLLASTQAPPELLDLASLLQPMKAPTRGLLSFR